jgi:hypothetical protein
MKKYLFTLSIGYPTAKREEEMEFDDDVTEQELEACYMDWRSEYLDGGWKEVK